MTSTRSSLVAVSLAVLAVAASACASVAPASGPVDASVDGSDDSLSVAVASFDLAVGDDQRFIAGVLTPDRMVIGGGEVEMAFAYLPTDGDPQPRGTTTASFLAVPGKEPSETLSQPTVLGAAAAHDHSDGADHSHPPDPADDPQAAGVYQTRVDLDQAGFWQVTATATIDGEHRTGTAAFEVASEQEVPDVGDPAPIVETLTLDRAVPTSAVDSRAIVDGHVPDPVLHTDDLADVLRSGRPAVVVFSTPVYCVSRFCGPITDTVEELAGVYNDRAAFVHVEIWSDRDAGELNVAVEEWIQTADGGSEPWVFLVGADGRIAARWDNVLDRDDLVSRLEQLPPAGSGTSGS